MHVRQADILFVLPRLSMQADGTASPNDAGPVRAEDLDSDQGVASIPSAPAPDILDPAGRHAQSWSIVGWVVALIALTLILGWSVLKLRRMLFPERPSAEDHAGLIEELRRMRQRGQLSPEEFDAAKRKWSESVKAAALAGPAGAGSAKSPSAGRSPAAGVPRSTGSVPPHATATGPGPRAVESGGVLRARPGFDLTGAPLPPESQG